MIDGVFAFPRFCSTSCSTIHFRTIGEYIRCRIKPNTKERRNARLMNKNEISTNNSFGDFLVNSALYDDIEIKKN